MINFKVEDNLTDYLTELESHLDAEREKFVGGLARKPVGTWGDPNEGEITLLAPKWNPFLYTTGQNRLKWTIKLGEKSSVEILYSAMKAPNLNTTYDDKTRRVWWEFADDDNPKKLGRDYAYYQETGEDPIARPEDAKHKHFIRDGLEASFPEIKRAAGRYLMEIMNLRKVPVRSGYFVER